MIDCFLRGKFRGFVLTVLEYCSAVRCSAADKHLKLLGRAVSGASFLNGRGFECHNAHRRLGAVLCMLYKIRCNPMRHLYGARPWPYVPVRVIHGALVAHRYTYEPPRCRTSQYPRLLFACQYLCGTIINDLDGAGLTGFKSYQELANAVSLV